MRRLPLWTVAGTLLVLAGCQKLSWEKEANLGAGKRWVIEGPQSEQKLTVKVTADEPVIAFIVLKDDEGAGDAGLQSRKKPSKALAGVEEENEIEFEVTVPAKKDFVVCVGPGKKAKKDPHAKVTVKSK
jgi:hypothetical protein